MYHDDDRPGRMVGRHELRARFPEVDPEVWSQADASFPVRVTRSFYRRLRSSDDPLARQALPRPAELVADPGDVPDPVGEGPLRLHPLVVQKHPDRALLLCTKRCHLYCRYCFRRDQDGAPDPGEAELTEALEVAQASGARELILSGGDPLSLSDARLRWLLGEASTRFRVLRVHSRAPVTAPWRITDELVALLAAHRPLWVVVHANHPDELAPDVDEALARLTGAGLPVLNQSVLLRGVNDDPAVLQALCEALVERSVKPYYLHHPDPVPGNAEFRLPLGEGWRIYAELRRRLSGVATPRYVIDPPDGSGKVDVADWLRRSGHAVPSPTQEA